MEGKLINLLMTSGIEPDELVLQRKWLDDQYAVLSCGDETEYYEAEGLLDLVEGILRLLSSEDKNIRNIYPPKTERHTAYCSECGSLLRWKWDPQLGGMDSSDVRGSAAARERDTAFNASGCRRELYPGKIHGIYRMAERSARLSVSIWL